MANVETVVGLSPIDQIMPRSYIRFLLFFPMSQRNPYLIASALQRGIHGMISHLPWLAGTVNLIDEGKRSGRIEIRYSAAYSAAYRLSLHLLDSETFPLSYKDLCDAGVPPSQLNGTVLSPLPDIADQSGPVRASAIQANFAEGGLILSIYVHHAITDGTGMGYIIRVLAESCRTGGANPKPAVNESKSRELLASSPPKCFSPKKHPEYKITGSCESSSPGSSSGTTVSPLPLSLSPPMSTTIFTFSSSKLASLKTTLSANLPSPEDPDGPKPWISTNDALFALIWSSVTRARFPLSTINGDHSQAITSTMSLPVNFRSRLTPPLLPTYLGCAFSSATATQPIAELISSSFSTSDCTCSPESAPGAYALAKVAHSIRHGIQGITPSYVASVAALSTSLPDVRNLQLNLHFYLGPDLVLTSWADLEIYDLDWGIDGLGKCQYLRKPRSLEDGLGGVMPKREGKWDEDGVLAREKEVEVFLGLRSEDMGRLRGDGAFMSWVGRVVE